MTPRNNGRPMPWEDTAMCTRPALPNEAGTLSGVCGGPMAPYLTKEGGWIACIACGAKRLGTPEEVEKTWASYRAWGLLESGLIHADRGCATCNGPLPLDRERTCADCVRKDNAARQVPLFS